MRRSTAAALGVQVKATHEGMALCGGDVRVKIKTHLQTRQHRQAQATWGKGLPSQMQTTGVQIDDHMRRGRITQMG
jgi:hypothetical protein